MKILLLSLLLISLAGCATAPQTMMSHRQPDLGIYQKAGMVEPFAWPLRGTILSAFGSKIDRVKNKGIDILAAAGSHVKAARSGRVVFCDEMFRGYGKTVILDHGDNYQTVYAYNSEILVKVGDAVAQNHIIAKAGGTGRAKEPSLHFEIRKNGEPQNPFHYLAR